MPILVTPESELRLSKALGNMVEALGILDDLDAPGEIGRLLDHAIVRLEKGARPRWTITIGRRTF